jgi:hypothetical protein
MRLFSWTGLCVLSSVLCTTCLAGAPGDPDSHQALKLLERQKSDSKNDRTTIVADAVPTLAAEDEESATTTAKKSNRPKTSATAKISAAPKTTAAAKTTSAATTKPKSTKTTSPKSSSSESSAKESSNTDSSTSITSKSSSPTPTASSTRASSTSSTNVPQETAILAPQPETAGRVNIGGIVAGVILGAAVVIGIAWIAIAKWRENKRHRAQYGDEESKRGFASGAAGGHYSSSQDSLLAGGKLAGGPNGLRLKALSPVARAHSFVSSFHQEPGSRIPQDVLPSPTSPGQAKSLPQLPHGEHQFLTPLGSHPITAELPPPDGAMPSAGLQAGRSVQRKPLPQINVLGPLHAQRSPPAYQQVPSAELPG